MNNNFINLVKTANEVIETVENAILKKESLYASTFFLSPGGGFLSKELQSNNKVKDLLPSVAVGNITLPKYLDKVMQDTQLHSEIKKLSQVSSNTKKKKFRL